MLRSEALAQKRVHHRARGLPLAIVVGLALSSVAVAAGDRLTLSGNWQAGPMSLQRAIGEWGPSCGPQPGAPGSVGGPVTIIQSTTELAFVGSGSNYSTATCWEKHSSLSRTKHSGGSRAWSSVCESSPDTNKKVTIRSVISATDSSIHLDETGQYQFQVDGQSCTASTRRTQTFTLLERTDMESPLQANAQADADCATPGDAARLDLSPTAPLTRPGQELQFVGKVRDSAGCAIGQPITWRITPEVDGVTVSDEGLVRVDESAIVESATLSAKAAGLKRQVVLRVASPGSYEALLNDHRGSLSRPPVRPDEASSASPSAVSTAVAVAEDRATSRKHWFVAIVGALAGVLALVGTGFVRQGRRKVPAVRQGVPSAHGASAVPIPRKVCPTCGSLYGDRAEFCGKDGSSLVQAN